MALTVFGSICGSASAQNRRIQARRPVAGPVYYALPQGYSPHPIVGFSYQAGQAVAAPGQGFGSNYPGYNFGNGSSQIAGFGVGTGLSNGYVYGPFPFTGLEPGGFPPGMTTAGTGSIR